VRHAASACATAVLAMQIGSVVGAAEAAVHASIRSSTACAYCMPLHSIARWQLSAASGDGTVLVVVVVAPPSVEVVVVVLAGEGAHRSFGASAVNVRLPKRSLASCGAGNGRGQRRA
jgi:hypothetical protein